MPAKSPSEIDALKLDAVYLDGIDGGLIGDTALTEQSKAKILALALEVVGPDEKYPNRGIRAEADVLVRNNLRNELRAAFRKAFQ